jgi:citrate lyase subunit beta / citryl-CoA lyase
VPFGRGLGYDGKWVLHPTQIEAYAQATTVQARGAVMLGDEMIDEASRKMAEAIMARGNAAGFTRGKTGEDPSLAIRRNNQFR